MTCCYYRGIARRRVTAGCFCGKTARRRGITGERQRYASDGGVFLQRDRATPWYYWRGTARRLMLLQTARGGGVTPWYYWRVERNRVTLRDVVLLSRDHATPGDDGVFLR